jgi:hypothetical protein
MNNCYSQWHNSKDTLKYPPHPFGESTMGWINRFDTVRCEYKTINRDSIYKGFRFIYRYSGYFIDKGNTFDIYFDEKLNRIYNVLLFRFY